ncbi:MAG: hypothetical protein C4541_12250 [Candidatus Auribacter fodinae]|jgi:ADP-ribosylglycohydrolase|uniref:ADP-ribosylglycohydrolase family protein n=1 Tax=Candidatus Auribacter fodinae TaxID=2093366 RepID=A0A3A4QWJ3_9BACT|nr:MAG: hypothetical protein C4541_12250 [Candidatus Auribacter fodinae]
MQNSFFTDKSCGTIIGSAIGDALGAPVEGLRPGHIKTLFKRLDSFVDVQQFKKKGIKYFRMKGLYTDDTQQVLAVCDTLIIHNSLTPDILSDTFISMSKHTMYGDCGVFRGSGYCFRKTMQSYLNGAEWDQAEGSTAGCMAAVRIPPVAIYYIDDPVQMKLKIIEAALVTHKDPIGISAALWQGSLIAQLLRLSPDAPLDIDGLLSYCAGFCREGEELLASQYSHLLYASHPDGIYAVSNMIPQFSKILQSSDSTAIDLFILEYARQYASQPLHKLTVPYALTLVPLAMRIFFLSHTSFYDPVVEAVNMGGDTDTLASLVGALTGSYRGFSAIPGRWVEGLVNMNQIKARAEALVKSKKGLELQELTEMEKKLTHKEFDFRQKFESAQFSKSSGSALKKKTISDEDDYEELKPSRKNKADWRQHEREKSMQKRMRRQNKTMF